MPEIQLTAGSVPHFPLRWDLAKELCWVEFKRTPLSFADYAIWRAGAQPRGKNLRPMETCRLSQELSDPQ